MPYILLLLVLMGVGFALYRYITRRMRRHDMLSSDLSPEEWQTVFEEVPILRKLPKKLRPKLAGKINLFLDQVTFHGCEGLEVEDYMRFSIAAQASLIVVNSDQWYDRLSTVLIYPGAFKSVQASRDGYVVTEEETVRLGESWSRGPVILSWQDSEQGALNHQDGHNVVLHEFAHQLDDLSGYTDGAPVMAKGQSIYKWEDVILEAYARHEQAVAQGRRTVLDAYGATNHEEFFAVAIEVFFEKPDQLKAEEPALYEQLSTLLRLDPASWG